MPNCFQLFPKGSSEAATLNSVDAAICLHLQEPVDEVRWCYNWFNSIGFLIALGNELGSQKLRDEVTKFYAGIEREKILPVMLKILTYLEDNYTSNGWVEIGKANHG